MSARGSESSIERPNGDCVTLARSIRVLNSGTEALGSRKAQFTIVSKSVARLSFDTRGLINKARQLIALYEQKRIPRERVLIKIAARASEAAKITLEEKVFRLKFNEDPMAVNKTAEGIRKLSADIVNLEKLIASRI